MNLTDVFNAVKGHKRKKRVGRGAGSGHGKTAGRGQKGLGSRTGANYLRGFVGGQTQLKERLPKVGFNNVVHATVYQPVNLAWLNENFDDGATVDFKTLREKGMTVRRGELVKVLGHGDIATGVDFFDHMLVLLAKHALFDLTVKAQGDTGVDAHHTVEDVGICLGKALTQALGDKRGIARYGFFLLPMDESLARVALDLSGRAHLEWRAEIPAEKCGTFDTCLGREFMRAFCSNGGINMHVDLLAAADPHHALEAIFKGVGRALRVATSHDPREKGVPSSKGVL